VPDAQVLIVGTHVDHPAMSRTTLQLIRQELRQLLSEARHDHLCYITTHADLLSDCLLCQTDLQSDDHQLVAQLSDARHVVDASQSSDRLRQDCCTASSVVNGSALAHSDDSDDDDDTALSNALREQDNNNERKRAAAMQFPHVVGYYEVSCTWRGVAQLRDAVTALAGKLISNNPHIPRRWSSVERSLAARTERSGSVCTLDELKDIASVQGITDPNDVLNMIHFFRAQGRILYFPQVSTLFPQHLSTAAQHLSGAADRVLDIRHCGLQCVSAIHTVLMQCE